MIFSIPRESRKGVMGIYFHGNAETMFEAECILRKISEETGIPIITIEYPRYSVYESELDLSEQITEKILSNSREIC